MFGRWMIIPWGFLAASTGLIRAVLQGEASPNDLIVAAVALAFVAAYSYWRLQRH